MRRAEWSLALGALVATVGGAALLLAARAGPGPSASSRGPGGLLAARLVLEEDGTPVTLLDREARGLPADTVLLTAFPWSRGAWSFEVATAQQHLNRGGSLVVAFSAGAPQAAEKALLAALGVGTRRLRGDPPLAPLAWRRFVDEEWVVAPPAAGADARVTRMRAPGWLPVPPGGAEVLLAGEDGTPVVFAFGRGRGTVAVLPAELVANCRLAEPGSADLLASLAASLGGAWCFDEFHHGLVAAGATGNEPVGPGFALLVAQLGLLYGLAALALGRRFGPAWRERTAAAGSPASFLRGLGVLHDRLGHHADAARLMLERARELHPRLHLPESPGDAARPGARGLVELGRELARRQREGRNG